MLKENERKKYFFNSKFRKGAVVASLVGITLFGVTAPIYAKNIPIVESVLNYFGIGNGYNKIIDEYGVSKEINGVKVTIDSAMYDGYELLVSYTVNSNKSIVLGTNDGVGGVGGIIYKRTNKDGNTPVKDKVYTIFSTEYGEFKGNDKKCYSGVLLFNVAGDSFDSNKKNKSIKEKVIDDHKIDPSKIPDKFTLELSLDKFMGIKGKLDFNLVIESEKAKGNVKEVTVNKDLSNLFPNTKLEKVIITPIRVYLQGTVSNKNLFYDYIVINDKKVALRGRGGEVTKCDGYGRYIGEFDSLNKDNKSITIIPYNYYQGEKINEVNLNLNGETKVPIGNTDYITITKTEEKDGKTYIYYKNQRPINHRLPFHLIDDKEVEYFRHENMNIDGESVAVYDGLLLSKNLKVINDTTIFYDEALTVDIK